MKLSIKLIIFSIVLFTLNSCCSFSDLPIVGCVKPNSNSSVPINRLLTVDEDTLHVDGNEYRFSFKFEQNQTPRLFFGMTECCGKFSTHITLPKGYIADKIWLLYLDKYKLDEENVIIENNLSEQKGNRFYFYINNLDYPSNEVIIRIKNKENVIFLRAFNSSINLIN